MPIDTIHNLIRGLSPYPAAWSTLQAENNAVIVIKIFKTQKEEITHNYKIGTIISDEKTFLKIAASNGFIYISELQISGKKRVEIMEFLRGFKTPQKYIAV
jgi:methionyl-tRNA formyltransferase